MNYKRIYDQLIADRKAKQHLLTSGYAEHHIVPRCMGGGDEPENKVKLTHADHLFAHVLLAMHYNTPGLWYAVAQMIGAQKYTGRKTRAWYDMNKRKANLAAREAALAQMAAMTPEELSAFTVPAREALYAKYALMTPEEIKAHMAPARAAQKIKLAAMSSEEKREAALVGGLAFKAKLETMTPEERKGTHGSGT
jgi:hypothetical protein